MKIIAINTIGLTGAEILAAELARFSEIRILPGQNFIQFKSRCYRPHEYSGFNSGEVFEMLSLHQYTNSGICWSGLTKSMSDALKQRYDKARHRALFESQAISNQDFLEVGRRYLSTFYESIGEDLNGVRYVGWFGNNIAVNSVRYPKFSERAVVINFSNPIDYWLANVNQRFVWNNLQTLKFWIVNELFLKWYSINNPGYLSIDIREYANNRDYVVDKIARFLDIDAKASFALPPDGFVRYNPKLVAKIKSSACEMVAIYRDHALFKLASTLDEWGPAFLSEPETETWLLRYRDFWNSTSHTNLDWVGPVEEGIIKNALAFTGVKSAGNINTWFYHDCFHLTCDHYQTPQGSLEHYLGCLEEEILLPELPYYARVVVCYLENVADNIVRRPYSATPIRDTNLYQRLTSREYAKYFPRWGMVEKIQALELKIDEANVAMWSYFDFENGES